VGAPRRVSVVEAARVDLDDAVGEEEDEEAAHGGEAHGGEDGCLRHRLAAEARRAQWAGDGHWAGGKDGLGQVTVSMLVSES
jgi:hypothetical protein